MLRARLFFTCSCSQSVRSCVTANHRRGLLTLAIESSCDDTSVAIVEKKTASPSSASASESRNAAATLHFHKTITANNASHKGIHPNVALVSHQSNLAGLIEESLKSLPDVDPTWRGSCEVLPLVDGSLKRKPDFVSATRGPGMRSNVNCGLDTAKGLSVAWQVPFVGVHHMQAHALTPRLVWATGHSSPLPYSDAQPRFPFLTLLASGGHTMLLHSTGLTSHTALATTGDTAIGDCLDKIGRLVLPPERQAHVQDAAFAKHLSAYAFPSAADFKSYTLPKSRFDETDGSRNALGIELPLSDTKEMAFSFSGIASRVHALFEARASLRNGTIDRAERLVFAQTALGLAFEHLAAKTIQALINLRRHGQEMQTLVVSGGVAANDFLRYVLREMLDSRDFAHVEIVYPPAELCTDNAAMIGWAGIEMFEAGWRSRLSCQAVRKWSMDGNEEDGGILGIDGWVQESESG